MIGGAGVALEPGGAGGTKMPEQIWFSGAAVKKGDVGCMAIGSPGPHAPRKDPCTCAKPH